MDPLVLVVTTVRRLRGSWPEWYVDSEGGVVFVRMRHGCAYIGVGDTEQAAASAASQVGDGDEYDGVTGAVDALLLLQKHGYWFVAPSK